MNQNDSEREILIEKKVKFETLGYQRSFSIEQPHEYSELKQKEQIAFEDSRVTKLIMGSHKLIENLRLQLMLVITVLWFIEIDDEFFYDKTTSDLILWLSFSLNLILIFFTYLSYVTLMNYWKATLLIPKDLSFYNSDQFNSFLFELCFLLIFPTVFTRDVRVNFTHKGNTYYYTINEIIILIGTLRSFLVLQISLRLCEFYNSQTQRLCLNYGITMKPAFLFKFMILSAPATLILTVFCVIFSYCTIAMWIAEKSIQRDHLRTAIRKHSFLEVTLALLAYAYENYVPLTNLGRIVCSYSQYAGFVMASILISAIIQAFEQEYGEFQACVLLDKLILKEDMYKVTSAIGEQFYYIMKFDINPFTYERVKTIQRCLKKFNNLKRQFKSIQSENVSNLFKRRIRETNDTMEDMQLYLQMQKQQSKQIHDMVDELISLQNYRYHNWVD